MTSAELVHSWAELSFYVASYVPLHAYVFHRDLPPSCQRQCMLKMRCLAETPV